MKLKSTQVGQRVAVQVYSPHIKQVEIEHGTVEAITGAIDRTYRVNVRSDVRGRFYEGCAPECVEPA